jgi:hypothetical protein
MANKEEAKVPETPEKTVTIYNKGVKPYTIGKGVEFMPGTSITVAASLAKVLCGYPDIVDVQPKGVEDVSKLMAKIKALEAKIVDLEKQLSDDEETIKKGKK